MLGALQAGLCGTPASSAFVPTQLGSTLKLWLRADLGVTGTSPVTAWADQSGNGNNFTAGTGTVVKTATSTGGLPALTFSGSSSLTCASNLVTGARTCFVVAKQTDSPNLGCMLDFRLTGLEHGYFYGGAIGSGSYIYGDGVHDASEADVAVDANPHVFMFGEDGTNAGVFYSIDNVACTPIVAGGPGQAAETGSAGMAIGFRTAYGIQGWAGPISEIIVCDTVLSAPNKAAVYSSLKARYGL